MNRPFSPAGTHTAPTLRAPATIGATRKSSPVGLQRAETPTEAAGASIPPHLIPTVRNNQLPTAELAELLNASPAEIDAIRALGHYSGGDLLESSLIARDLGSEVVL